MTSCSTICKICLRASAARRCAPSASARVTFVGFGAFSCTTGTSALRRSMLNRASNALRATSGSKSIWYSQPPPPETPPRLREKPARSFQASLFTRNKMPFSLPGSSGNFSSASSRAVNHSRFAPLSNRAGTVPLILGPSILYLLAGSSS
ncbi:hypothetical protein PsAD37_01812 [Pseudovibrio sp. Ad37]|nr:hypothetical protein PsAD37_01812 [Pseudovibrio sp. Ad37]